MKKSKMIFIASCLWWVSIAPLYAGLGEESEYFLFDVPGLPNKKASYASASDDSLVNGEQGVLPNWVETEDHSSCMRILLNNFRHTVVGMEGKKLLFDKKTLNKLKKRYVSTSKDKNVLWDFYSHVKTNEQYYRQQESFKSMSATAYKLSRLGIRELMKIL